MNPRHNYYPWGCRAAAPRFGRYCPTKKVPLLDYESHRIWESLAIGEYLAEVQPDAGLWPRDPGGRALRAPSAAKCTLGFDQSERMPMDICNRHTLELDPTIREEIDRVLEKRSDCRARFGIDGPFLFGDFGIADAMYAPVVTRFRSYGVLLDEPASSYATTVLAWP